MRNRTGPILLLAVIFGGLAAWIAYSRLNLSPPTAEVPTVELMTAALDIPFGSRIEPQAIRAVTYPANLAPPGAITDRDALAGMLAQQDIFVGEVFIERRVGEMLAGSSLAYAISPEMRAVTVRVNDVIGVGGFLLPGNRVDVMAAKGGRNSKEKAEIILQNLKVLAVDQQARSDKNDPIVVRAVTLEVTPEQATELFEATQEGAVQMALRNPDDDSEVVKATPTPRPRAPIRRAVAPAPTPDTTVTVIRGTTSDTSRAQD